MRVIVGDDGRPLLIMPGDQVESFLAHCESHGTSCTRRPYDSHGDELIEFEPDLNPEQANTLMKEWEKSSRR